MLRAQPEETEAMAPRAELAAMAVTAERSPETAELAELAESAERVEPAERLPPRRQPVATEAWVATAETVE